MVMFLKCDTTEVGTGKEWFEVEVFVISAICILKQFEFGFCVPAGKMDFIQLELLIKQ
jgi:hypothetical protein